ncbi:hypothetical protein ACFQ61_03910 [Streptomyces sp. NPDC056500]|uniref:WD40 repeat domain-containing protein n=1 Tax=Streptomyces sp. NPDC056500 TaxID=3345840 RepID=UPI0036784C92
MHRGTWRLESVSFHPYGDTLTTAGNDSTVRLWDVRYPRRPQARATLTAPPTASTRLSSALTGAPWPLSVPTTPPASGIPLTSTAPKRWPPSTATLAPSLAGWGDKWGGIGVTPVSSQDASACGCVLPPSTSHIWAHPVLGGGTAETCLGGVRIQVICSMCAGS